MATIFSDDFNRADSNTVGNGWSEEEAGADDVKIASNKLVMLTSDAAVAYRTPPGGQYNGITIRFVAERDSTGSDDGFAVRYSTGGRNVISGSLVLSIAFSSSATIQVHDNGTSKGSFVKNIPAATQHNFRWDIHPDNSMEVRVWAVGDTEPASPDLSIAAFTPANTDTLWAFGNRNGIRYDSITVDELFEIIKNESITVTESVTVNITAISEYSINVSDTVTVTESVSRLLISFINVSETITVSESVTVDSSSIAALSINVSDSITVTESLTMLAVNRIEVSDQATITESVSVALSATIINVFDSITVSEGITKLETIFVSVFESITVTDVATASFTVTRSIEVSEDIIVTVAGSMIATPPYTNESKNTTIYSSTSKNSPTWVFQSHS